MSAESVESEPFILNQNDSLEFGIDIMDEGGSCKSDFCIPILSFSSPLTGFPELRIWTLKHAVGVMDILDVFVDVLFRQNGASVTCTVSNGVNNCMNLRKGYGSRIKSRLCYKHAAFNKNQGSSKNRHLESQVEKTFLVLLRRADEHHSHGAEKGLREQRGVRCDRVVRSWAPILLPQRI